MVRASPWLLEALRAARDVDPPGDAEVEMALSARLPGVPWDAKNQAAVHTWYGRVFGGQVAPCRRNPRRVTDGHYDQRVRDKRITARWPRVEVVLEQRGQGG